MKKLTILLSLFLFTFLVSCGGKSNEELIVGDWEMSIYDGSTPKTVSCIKFNEDKTARFYYLDETITEMMDSYGMGEGTWSIDGENLHVEQNTMNPITYKIVKITESELHIESDGPLGALSQYKKK